VCRAHDLSAQHLYNGHALSASTFLTLFVERQPGQTTGVLIQQQFPTTADSLITRSFATLLLLSPLPLLLLLQYFPLFV